MNPLMFLMAKAHLVVSPSGAGISTSAASTTCYAHITYNADGIEYENSSGTSPTTDQSRGNWLDSGAASDVWIERTVDVGSLDTDAGASRLILSTSRTYGIASAGIKTATVTFNFYDAASGGSLINTAEIVFDVDGT